MAKFNIPSFKYIFQDECGNVWASTEEPTNKDETQFLGARTYQMLSKEHEGKENPNWRDTLIDIDVDDYDFEDGILRRIEK